MASEGAQLKAELLLSVAGIPPSPKYKRREKTRPSRARKVPGSARGLLSSWALRAAARFPPPGPVGTPPRFPRSPHLANDAPRRSGSATDLPCSVTGFMLVPCISYLPLLTPQIAYIVHAVREGRLALETLICLPSAQGINTKAVSAALSHPSVPPTSPQTARPTSELALPSLPGVAP